MPNVIKLYTAVFFQWGGVFFPGLPFQPSLMFVGKARSLRKSSAFESWFTQVGSGFTRKHETRLERPARYKQSSLLRSFENYILKKFHNMGPWLSANFCLQNWKSFIVFKNSKNRISTRKLGSVDLDPKSSKAQPRTQIPGWKSRLEKLGGESSTKNINIKLPL